MGLARTVEERLRWDSRVDVSGLHIEEDGGNVRLEGTVPSYRGKYAATDIVRSVEGVRSVENRLAVSFPRQVSDEEIRENVEAMLRWNPDIDADRITVIVEDGHIRLSGSVDSFWKKALIEADVTNMIGVEQITNALGVIPKDEIVDTSIEQNILDAIERNVYVDHGVSVSVQEGVVTLSGEMPSRSAREAALDIATSTYGVRDVVDDLAVA